MKTFENDEARDESVAADLTARADLGVITTSICREVADQYELSTRSVMVRVIRLGLPYSFSEAAPEGQANDENDGADNDDREIIGVRTRSTPPVDDQYGVLQGPAILLAGVRRCGVGPLSSSLWPHFSPSLQAT